MADPDITVTIPGRLRYWVAEAALDMVIAQQTEASHKRKRSTMRQIIENRAGDLRALSDTVRP